MNTQINRRKFVAAASLTMLTGPAVVAQAAGRPAPASKAPTPVTGRRATPAVVASANGNTWKDGEGLTCVARAFKALTEGADVLDAVIAGVNIVEREPGDMGVGYGGLPNADGVVQLDASVMHGPLKRAGSVACLEGVRTPSLVARAVMDHTDHHLLVGRDAQRFARNMGFTIEDDLNTDKSRQAWLEWKRATDPKHYPDPKKRAEAGDRVRAHMVAAGRLDAEHVFGTINCNGVNARGELGGVTTTSGLAFKIPGRVGDSPILGAGLYVDGEIGAAGSTGRGEANLFSLCSFLIVEGLRQGRSPKDAGMEALRRIAANTVEQRLLNDRGRPGFNVYFYIVNVRGDYAGVSLYEHNGAGQNRSRYAVCTESGPQTVPTEPLFEGGPVS